MDPSVRRSKRKRAPNPRYSEDASKLLESLDPGLTGDSPDDAAIATYAETPRQSDEDGSGSASDVYFQEQSEALASSPPASSAADVSDTEMAEVIPANQSPHFKVPISKGTRERPPGYQHVRGLPGHLKIAHFKDVAQVFGGTDPSHQTQFIEMMTHWMSDGMLPSKTLIALAQSQDKRGPGETPADTSTADEQWAWYYKYGGKEKIEQLQITELLPLKQAMKYYPPRHMSHKVVLGPQGHQTLFEMEVDRPLHLAEAWEQARTSTPVDATEKDYHLVNQPNGWLINLGAKIHCLSWAPNRNSDKQYLVVGLDHAEPGPVRRETAFEPTSGFKSCIQIWQFNAAEDDNLPKTFDPTQPPLLAFSICTEWGMCQAIEWCPVADIDTGTLDDDGHLGLLATIWSDGYVRLLDIHVPKKILGSSTYVKYNRAAFESKPPHTICTTVTWSSTVDLIAGCASGKVAIWDISEAIHDTEAEEKSPRSIDTDDAREVSQQKAPEIPPYLFHQLHDTWILAMKACLPRYPHLLVTAAADGYYRLCDLRNPDFDTVESHRYRLYPSVFDYCPHAESIIACDGADAANLLHVRRFFAESSMAVCDAQIMAIACGRAHTYTLLGSADGSVLAFNVIPRVLKDKRAIKRLETVWFKHDWMPLSGIGSAEWFQEQHVPMSNMSGEEEPIPSQGQLRPGISRIVESFAPRLKGYKTSTSAKKKTKTDESRSSRWETIFEEASAVTQLEWNPMPRCGGWAAAGMGSGLLRVEDLSM